MVFNLSEDVIEADEKVRKDIGAIESLGFKPVPEEQTEEEEAAIRDEIKLKKDEAAKKSKAKPKTEEEEAEEIKGLIQKTSHELGTQLSGPDSKKVKVAENEIELIKTRWLMQNHIKMDKSQYDCINRKLSIYDIELGSRDIILRLDLDILLSPFVPTQSQLNAVTSQKSLGPPRSVGRDSRVDARKSELDSVISASPLGAEEEFWKQR
jgi:hypothetical protein